MRTQALRNENICCKSVLSRRSASAELRTRRRATAICAHFSSPARRPSCARRKSARIRIPGHEAARRYVRQAGGDRDRQQERADRLGDHGSRQCGGGVILVPTATAVCGYSLRCNKRVSVTSFVSESPLLTREVIAGSDQARASSLHKTFPERRRT